MTPSLTQDAVNTALAAFLTSVLPAGVKVNVGQVNRVAEPLGDFVVMTPLRRPRLATNFETDADTKFTGSIAATIMTVTAVAFGELLPGNPVFGTGVTDGTVVVDQLTGPTGGDGTYTVDPAQTVTSRTLAAGTTEIEQDTDCVMQLDVHGPASTDNAQTISTLMRSAYAVEQLSPSGVTPLYADDPRQLPFITAANQYEERWSIDVHLQINPIVSAPTQFADSAALTVVDVDVAYHD